VKGKITLKEKLMFNKRLTYTKTASTFDSDAIAINASLNDVARMCKLGHQLKKILESHFEGSEKRFKKWARTNLDKDPKSIMRYICLAENEDLLRGAGIIKLSEAYELLGIDGNPVESDESEAA
jgi:hypothetical protein